MFRVESAGRELRPAPGQYAQESFTALVDEGDFVQVHDASAFHISAVVLPPARPELTYPGVREPAMKNPSLFRWCFTEIDLQHAIPSERVRRSSGPPRDGLFLALPSLMTNDQAK